MRRIRLRTAFILFAVLGFVIWLYQAPTVSPHWIRKTQTQTDTVQFATGLNVYQTEYGRPLAGTPAHLLSVLLGDNPRKIAFIEVSPERINKQGEFTDAWGTPFKVIPKPTDKTPDRLGVYSFGKDKKDDQGVEGSDDITSWKYLDLN